MSILSGIKKVIPYFKNADGNYEQLSYKTSSQTVDFDDGKTAETKLGAIKGITTSTSVTETGYAADAKTVSEINQSLENKVGLIWTSKTLTFNENGDVTFETTDKTIVAVQLHEVYSDVSICVIVKTYVLHSIGLRNQTVSVGYAYY